MGLFGNQGGGLFGGLQNPQVPDYAGPLAASLSAQPQKKKFDWGKAAVGFFAPELIERQREQEAAVQADQARQQAAWDMWVRQQEYQRANPNPPPPNDTERDFQFISQQIGEDAAKSFLKNKTLPPMVAVDVQNPDGSVSRQFYPRGGTAAPQSGGTLTDDDIRRMEQGGAGRSGPPRFR